MAITMAHRRSAPTVAPRMSTGALGMKGGKACGTLPQMALTMAFRTLLRPMVTMMTEMIGSPIIGRRTKRSTSTPSATATRMVRIMPIGQAMPNCPIIAKMT